MLLKLLKFQDIIDYFKVHNFQRFAGASSKLDSQGKEKGRFQKSDGGGGATFGYWKGG